MPEDIAKWLRQSSAAKPNCVSRLRRRIEEIIGIYGWMPWWKFQKYILGFGAQIVIVGCHLDSAAERTPGGYQPHVDPAPGMDDDATGIARVELADARVGSVFDSIGHSPGSSTGGCSGRRSAPPLSRSALGHGGNTFLWYEQAK